VRMVENRSRPIHLHVMVDERERALIDRKMAQAGIRSINAYIRKMAIDGYVVYADMSDVYDIHHNESSYFNESNNPISLQILHIAAHVESIYKSMSTS
jgi:hypothetical protein